MSLIITPEILKRMRTAVSVSFRCAAYDDAPTVMELTHEHRGVQSDTRLEMKSTAFAYNRNGKIIGACFEYIPHLRSYDTWNSVASILRKGDELTARWTRGALDTETLREAGFTSHALELVIHRGDKALSFTIATHVSPVDYQHPMIELH